jgi:ABC-2 type transport system ATP-binding protein/capsular polysaccharide transport system ATP-binding protein
MINVDHVHKAYPTRQGNRVVLDDISFALIAAKSWGSWAATALANRR